MHEADNRTNAELAQPAKALVCPAPIDRIERLGRELFPQNRITQRPNAESCDPVEIVEPVEMTAKF
jgi:hypothetical protein